jgi:predicted permease
MLPSYSLPLAYGDTTMNLVDDVRFGARMLRRTPGFTIVAVLTLALGIGANTAIFSIVNSVLLAPLPFPNPDRLVIIRNTLNGQTYPGPSPADGLDYARLNHTLERMSMFDYWPKNVSGDGMEPQEMAVGLTPADYFETLGIKPLKGRLFTAQENTFGKHYVAVIAASFWHAHFADDPNILGRTLRINDEPYAIIGVVPDAIPIWMAGQRRAPAQIWTPFTPYAKFFDESLRGDRGVYNIARLKLGVTIQEAETDVNLVAGQLAQQYPIDKGVGVKITRLADERSGPLRASLVLLLGAVALILLIACSNVANLMLMRNSARQREFAVRAALGGARIDIIRPLFVESALLAVIGGAVAVFIASAGLAFLMHVRPDRLPQLATVSINTRVLFFTLTVSLVTTVLFGLWPAFATTRINIVDSLKDAGRSATAAPSRLRVRRLLVISEVAFALMLMIGAGLLLRSIALLQSQQLGFASDHLLRAHLYLPPARYRDSSSLTRFVDIFSERVRELPGVRAACITTLTPPWNNWRQEFSKPGQAVGVNDQLPLVNFGLTDEHFLDTFGIPVLHGRNFTAADAEQAPPVVLINQTLAHQFFANEDPIGKRIHLGHPGIAPATDSPVADSTVTIVGVVADTRNRGLDSPVEPQVIGLFRQTPALNFGFKELVVRSSVEPHAVTSAINDQLHRMDPDMPLAEVETIDEVITRMTSDRRFTTVLLGLFAALALVLAIIGVYGLIARMVVERTHEIGVRMALGAQYRDIIWLVTRPAVVMGVSGAVIGLAGAIGVCRLIRTMLFGISPTDPLTFIAGAGCLLLAVIAAAVVPARRAYRVDPMIALRQE